MMLAQSIVASMALNRVNRESALAGDGTRQVIEMLQGRLDFDAVFEDFRPGSPTGPGSGFAVAGLEPVEGDPDGLVGEIVFPTLSTVSGIELRGGRIQRSGSSGCGYSSPLIVSNLSASSMGAKYSLVATSRTEPASAS